jgi:hypothetical protein
VPAPAEPETPSSDGLRASALQRLLPPLVHRLNNSLAVLQGVHELGPRADRAELELARVHLAQLGLVLARVGLFAREPSGLARRLVLGEVAAAVTLLLAPLAESRGVALELELDATGTLEVDGHFEGLLVTAACELITRRGAEAGPVPRVRISGRPAGRVLLFALGSSAAPGHSLALQALAEHARTRGWRTSLRGAARAVVLRLAVPAAALAPAPAKHARSGARVLLLCRPGEERELVERLLREHGFGVVAADEPPAGGVFDLARVVCRRTDADPELAARLAAR